MYTGVGEINWLPDIAGWARVVAAVLRPGGRLHLREGHPVLWSLADPRPDGLLTIEYPYFELPQPSMFEEPGTYVQTEHDFTHNRTYEWNHGLGQIVTALLDAGMSLTLLVEHDSVPWDALPGMMDALPGGGFRLRDRPERLPHSYTLQAVKAHLTAAPIAFWSADRTCGVHVADQNLARRERGRARAGSRARVAARLGACPNA